MGYRSRRGRRPDEAASKSAHSHVINDSAVVSFLDRCSRPATADEVALTPELVTAVIPPVTNPIRFVIAIDGGFTEVEVQPAFPSSRIAFFQFGALVFSTDHLESLERQAFIEPADMAKLKNIQRLKLVLPIRNVSLSSLTSLTHTVRLALYEFFRQDRGDASLMDALEWLVFRMYRPRDHWSTWTLASCPSCGARSVELAPTAMQDDRTFVCPKCGQVIYLTDVFRLHEAIDDEIGAGGILGYVTTALEQLLLVFVIKLLLEQRPTALHEVLFIKDGPLAFFGQTANLFQPMRDLVGFLFERHDLYLAGLEKSGAFVEHADEISNRMEPGSALLLSNDYIYRYILAGRADPSSPYGRSTYYGNKVIYMSATGQLHVATLPTAVLTSEPARENLRNLDVVLHNIQTLRCDMYDSALLPIALVNKLVSLADHPSAAVLKAFAKRSLGVG